MRAVDTAVFEEFEAAGFWVPAMHEDEDPAPTPPANAIIIRDGLVTVDNTTNVVTYDLPYAVFYSNVGDDDATDNPRLIDVQTRRSVFMSLVYIGEDRNQAKWAGEKIRDVISDKRFAVPGHRAWKCKVSESQRVRRDDDAMRPDGSPLFYGVDNYALSVVLNH